jgi:hypothetical protein
MIVGEPKNGSVKNGHLYLQLSQTVSLKKNITWPVLPTVTN